MTCGVLENGRTQDMYEQFVLVSDYEKKRENDSLNVIREYRNSGPKEMRVRVSGRVGKRPEGTGIAFSCACNLHCISSVAALTRSRC